MTDEGRIALTILEAAAMAYWSVLMLELIEDSYAEYVLTTDELEDAMHQQIQMAQTMHAHTLGVTHVFLQRAMEEAFAYPIDEVEYASICAESGKLINQTFGVATDAERFYHNAFCMPRRMSGACFRPCTIDCGSISNRTQAQSANAIKGGSISKGRLLNERCQR